MQKQTSSWNLHAVRPELSFLGFRLGKLQVERDEEGFEKNSHHENHSLHSRVYNYSKLSDSLKCTVVVVVVAVFVTRSVVAVVSIVVVRVVVVACIVVPRVVVAHVVVTRVVVVRNVVVAVQPLLDRNQKDSKLKQEVQERLV